LREKGIRRDERGEVVRKGREGKREGKKGLDL